MGTSVPWREANGQPRGTPVDNFEKAQVRAMGRASATDPACEMTRMRGRAMTVHESVLSAKVTGMFRLSPGVMVDE
ncbi:hypothetical protein GCM10023191_058750 [Actinoallomurus oryzae]|uniref:Transposase n=1 Tax=Actinoallomurus oryzae TaxID=502180 RepID=A0ABP8QN61_9ACTN